MFRGKKGTGTWLKVPWGGRAILQQLGYSWHSKILLNGEDKNSCGFYSILYPQASYSSVTTRIVGGVVLTYARPLLKCPKNVRHHYEKPLSSLPRSVVIIVWLGKKLISEGWRVRSCLLLFKVYSSETRSPTHLEDSVILRVIRRIWTLSFVVFYVRVSLLMFFWCVNKAAVGQGRIVIREPDQVLTYVNFEALLSQHHQHWFRLCHGRQWGWIDLCQHAFMLLLQPGCTSNVRKVLWKGRYCLSPANLLHNWYFTSRKVLPCYMRQAIDCSIHLFSFINNLKIFLR